MRLPLLFAAILPAFACQVIDTDRIFGKDLAAASALFASLDPKVVVGAAPVPGIQRVLRPEELVRLAKQNNVSLSEPAVAVCFERATEPLTAEQLLPAMRQALAIETAQIEILEFSHVGVPRGTVEFSKSSLMPNGMWRGRIVYDQNRSMPIWVKARITAERTWVEASEPIAVGKVIEASQLILKTGPRFPFDPPLIATVDLIAGRKLLRNVAAGTPIALPMLAIAHDVERGDLVAVEVKVGGAILDFEATAESSGRKGDTIMIKNPENGRSFQAKIQDKGHVLVQK